MMPVLLLLHILPRFVAILPPRSPFDPREVAIEEFTDDCCCSRGETEFIV
jgi:hypothetical protein